MSYLCHTIINYFSPEINISGIETDINIKLTALFLAHMKQSCALRPRTAMILSCSCSSNISAIFYHLFLSMWMLNFSLHVWFPASDLFIQFQTTFFVCVLLTSAIKKKKKSSNFKSHSTRWASELNLRSKKRNCWKTRAYCANPFSDVNNRTLFFFLFQLKRELQQTYVINVVVRTHKTDIQI